MNTHRASIRVMLPLMLGSLLATACSPQQPDATSTTTPRPADTAEGAQAASSSRPAAGKAVVGRYVDPQSLQVTGIDTKFAATDRVFASLPLTGTTAGTAVGGRLLGADGVELAKRDLTLLGGESSVNFDFDIGTQLKLVPGQYKIEFLLMGEPAGSIDFSVE